MITEDENEAVSESESEFSAMGRVEKARKLKASYGGAKDWKLQNAKKRERLAEEGEGLAEEGEGLANTGQIVVVCPPNGKPGDELWVRYKGKQYLIDVPDVLPGQSFKVDVQAAPAEAAPRAEEAPYPEAAPGGTEAEDAGPS